MVFSSPSDWINWIELSRPTVSGSTACGNNTVSRTGSTGNGRPDGLSSRSSADLEPFGLMMLTKSLGMLFLECPFIKFHSIRCIS
jgi:hypothetical protein